MKKILFSALILITTLLVVFTACACGKNKGGNENGEANEEAVACNHEWNLVNSKLPLCKEGGYALYRCEHCNEEKTVTSNGCVYEYEFTLNGESCEDGFESKKTCTICGETSYASFSNHVLFEAASKELCGGEVAVISKCPCGEFGKAEYKKCVASGWSEGDETLSTDENGVVHTTREFWCTSCGFSIKTDSYQEVDGCNTITKEIGQILDGNDKVIIEYFNPAKDIESNHDLAYSYKDFDGKASCEDGYTVVETCQACAYTNEYTYNAHDLMYLNTVVDFTEKGACGGQIKVISCPCGINKRATLNVCSDAEISITQETVETIIIETTTYYCQACGLCVTHEERMLGIQVNEKYTITINGEEIYTVGYVYDTTK